MTIDEIRKRLTDCPIPEGARADWKGTNHYEITTPAKDTDYWWLNGLGWESPRHAGWSHTENGKRLGAVLDYACHYRADVAELLARIDQALRHLHYVQTAGLSQYERQAHIERATEVLNGGEHER